MAEGLIKMRKGKVRVQPGYDGEYGIVSIKADDSGGNGSEQQLSFF
jgi:PHP family Zn ribbon phosphoesterase